MELKRLPKSVLKYYYRETEVWAHSNVKATMLKFQRLEQQNMLKNIHKHSMKISKFEYLSWAQRRNDIKPGKAYIDTLKPLKRLIS